MTVESTVKSQSCTTLTGLVTLGKTSPVSGVQFPEAMYIVYMQMYASYYINKLHIVKQSYLETLTMISFHNLNIVTGK